MYFQPNDDSDVTQFKIDRKLDKQWILALGLTTTNATARAQVFDFDPSFGGLNPYVSLIDQNFHVTKTNEGSIKSLLLYSIGSIRVRS